VGPFKTPHPGKSPPRRRQPRGDGGGFEGVDERREGDIEAEHIVSN
jgi:hypothetical protein